MSVACLRSFSEGNIEEARRSVDYLVPDNCSLLGHRQINRRLKMIDADPSQHPWMYRAIVRKEDRQMVGFISFHHKAPDPNLSEYAQMSAELGYTIEQAFRRRGYATESAIGMMDWAFREFGVREFVLTISPENRPSLKMAESMHFEIIGQHEDPIDGTEFVMKASIDQILKTKQGYQDASDNAERTGP
jgi:RimJ/RimL family protein N-acetyltransferase